MVRIDNDSLNSQGVNVVLSLAYKLILLTLGLPYFYIGMEPFNKRNLFT